jgi:hypothetical protein
MKDFSSSPLPRMVLHSLYEKFPNFGFTAKRITSQYLQAILVLIPRSDKALLINLLTILLKGAKKYRICMLISDLRKDAVSTDRIQLYPMYENKIKQPTIIKNGMS